MSFSGSFSGSSSGSFNSGSRSVVVSRPTYRPRRPPRSQGGVALSIAPFLSTITHLFRPSSAKSSSILSSVSSYLKALPNTGLISLSVDTFAKICKQSIFTLPQRETHRQSYSVYRMELVKDPSGVQHDYVVFQLYDEKSTDKSISNCLWRMERIAMIDRDTADGGQQWNKLSQELDRIWMAQPKETDTPVPRSPRLHDAGSSSSSPHSAPAAVEKPAVNDVVIVHERDPSHQVLKTLTFKRGALPLIRLVLAAQTIHRCDPIHTQLFDQFFWFPLLLVLHAEHIAGTENLLEHSESPSEEQRVDIVRSPSSSDPGQWRKIQVMHLKQPLVDAVVEKEGLSWADFLVDLSKRKNLRGENEAESGRLRQEIETEIERVQREIERVRDYERVQRETERLNRESERLDREIENRNRELERLHQERERQGQEIERLKREIEISKLAEKNKEVEALEPQQEHA